VLHEVEEVLDIPANKRMVLESGWVFCGYVRISVLTQMNISNYGM
jgi:hypothetical protein